MWRQNIFHTWYQPASGKKGQSNLSCFCHKDDFLLFGEYVAIGHEGEHENHLRSMYLPEISENKAKSFLYVRPVGIDAAPDPSYCKEMRYELWCEHHKPYCQVGKQRMK